MRSLRVRYDWATSLSLFTFMHWRRKWQPTPVFLPGESQGWGNLVGCRLWGRTESTRLKRLSSSMNRWRYRKLLLLEKALDSMGCFCPQVRNIEPGAGIDADTLQLYNFKRNCHMEKATEIKSRLVERVFVNSACLFSPPSQVKG